MTFLFADSVIQASDRRLTIRDEQGLSVYDSSANKTIVYVGKDCRLVLGYTGPGHVEGIPTDAWISGLLTGMAQPSQIGMGGRPRGPMRAEEVLQLLTRKLPARMHVSVGGFELTPSGQHPLLCTIGRHSLSRAYEVGNPRRYAYGTMIPPSWATNDTMSPMLQMISQAPPQEYESVLIEAIRRIAVNHSEVGRDIMVVEVAEERRWIGAGLHIEPDADGKAPILYTPALIFPTVEMAPMQLNEARWEAVIQLGGISFGPIEDFANDCVLVLNVNQSASYFTAFADQIRSMPPRLW